MNRNEKLTFSLESSFFVGNWYKINFWLYPSCFLWFYQANCILQLHETYHGQWQQIWKFLKIQKKLISIAQEREIFFEKNISKTSNNVWRSWGQILHFEEHHMFLICFCQLVMLLDFCFYISPCENIIWGFRAGNLIFHDFRDKHTSLV